MFRDLINPVTQFNLVGLFFALLLSSCYFVIRFFGQIPYCLLLIGKKRPRVRTVACEEVVFFATKRNLYQKDKILSEMSQLFLRNSKRYKSSPYNKACSVGVRSKNEMSHW